MSDFPNTPNTSPLTLANAALGMGRSTEGADAKFFNKIALVAMSVTALAAVINTVTPAVERLVERLIPQTHAEREHHRRKKLTGRDFHER
jgi:hypothetical protein